MIIQEPDEKRERDDSGALSDDDAGINDTSPDVADRPKEIGGRGGLDPTRYGDWEKSGRCIDF